MNITKLLGACLGLAMFALGSWIVPPAQAHQDPVGCNASALQQTPSVDPVGDVLGGQTVSYSVLYSNLDPDGAGSVSPCNVTMADATITTPGGDVIDVLTGVTLNVGESISCPGDAGCAPGPYTYEVDVADANGGSQVTAAFNIAGVLHQSTGEEQASDFDTLSNTVLNPSTALSLTSSVFEVLMGGTATLTIMESNDGDAGLTGAYVEVDNGVGILDDTHSSFTGDDDLNGVLDPGETWQWEVDVTVLSDTTYTATGHGMALGFDFTWCEDEENPGEGVMCDQDEQASVMITLIEEEEEILGCTLTQGYWKNHQESWPVDSLMIGTTSYTMDELLSIFKQPVKGNGLVSMSHQLIAAMLNVESGATLDADTAQALDDANALVGDLVVPPVGSDWLAPSTTSSLNAALASFNEGMTGPGHCSE